jgi:Meiotically Up-regulated Gene 113 (MUG113) protein
MKSPQKKIWRAPVNLEQERPGYVYALSYEGSNLIKIGMTCKQLWQRVRDLQTGSPLKIRVLAAIKTPMPKFLESLLHSRFEIYCTPVGTASEFFQLPEHIIIRIKREFHRQNNRRSYRG